MSTYKVSELAGAVRELIQCGYDYADVSVLEEDEDFPASLGFDGVCDFSTSEEIVEIESVEIPDNYVRGFSPSQLNADDVSNSLSFSFDELCVLMNAVDNALAYMKELAASPNCDKSEKDEIKISFAELRNMQAKFAKFRKKYHIQ